MAPSMKVFTNNCRLVELAFANEEKYVAPLPSSPAKYTSHFMSAGINLLWLESAPEATDSVNF